jgi:signal transduction histidine kinase
MSAETVVARGNLYARLWKGVPRELGYLLLAFPLATIGFGVTISMFWGGVGTIVTFFIGVVILIACLYVARAFGTLDLVRLEWAGRPPVRRPEWLARKPGFWSWLRSVLLNGHYWVYLLHTMIVNFVVSIISWTLTIVWLSVGLGGISYWFWSRFVTGGKRHPVDWVIEFVGGQPSAVDLHVANDVMFLILGLILLATLPFLTRGLVLASDGIAHGMLGAWRSEALTRQVAQLSESRGAAASAEGHSLRRLERDIHDGPQQRLVRMQMDLAAAGRQLDNDPEKARGLIEEAMQQSKDALEELRALSRGFAPPILLDRGLVAALESAATRSPIQTRVIDSLPNDTHLPQEIERNAYFVASEALTNAVKHSNAKQVTIVVALRPVQEPDETWLDVMVTDDGSGGATAEAGHGLAGLEERLRGVGGVLEFSSPLGGPTVVAAHLPVTVAMSPSS